MSKKLTYGKILDKMKKLESKQVKMPWKVWTCFWENPPSVLFSGDQISFSEGDYKTKDEIVDALKWLLSQFEEEIDHETFWNDIEKIHEDSYED